MTKEGYIKHKEIIEKWAQGAEIEVESYLWGGKRQWDPVGRSSSFLESKNYRLKPSQKNIKHVKQVK